MKTSAIALWLILFYSYQLTAQNPSLVADVNTMDKQINLYGDVINYNGLAYFDAVDNDGLYLWRSDGTALNTTKVAQPGFYQSPYGQHPPPGIVTNGLLFYRCNEDASEEDRNKLFITDGTQGGTYKVSDKVMNPYNFIVMNNKAYFSGVEPDSTKYNLWKSDGTDSGTVKVFEFENDPYNFDLTATTAVNNQLIFALGALIYVTDGTESGTSFLMNMNPGMGIYAMVTFQNNAYFFASDPTNGIALWKSDGTILGTQMVFDFDLQNQADIFSARSVSVLNDKLIIITNDYVHGVELWTSDGTDSGTTMVKDINPGSGDGFDSYAGMTVIGNEVYFKANDGVHGYELWKSDGTTQGTVMVADILSGITNSSPRSFTPFNNKIAFIANYLNDLGLYITDGSDTGTHEIAALSTPSIFQLTTVANHIVMKDGYKGQLWVSDGTAPGTSILSLNINQNESSNPNQMVKLDDGKYLFDVLNGNTRNELWATDGTLSGSEYLVTNPNQYNEIDLCPITVNDLGFFSARTDSLSPYDALWKSDGTSAGTMKLKEIEAEFGSGSVVLNNILYFMAHGQGFFDNQLWRTDGTDTGTYVVKDISANGNDNVNFLVFYNGEIYFHAGDNFDKELWKSDGTDAGTQLAVDINPSGSSSPSNIAVANGSLYFAATTNPEGQEPWISDGTPGGTTLLKNIYTSTNKDSKPNHFTLSGSYVYFSAENHNYGNELWRTDGTNTGTQLVKDVEPADLNFSPDLLVDWNGVLFFASSNDLSGEIWRTTGDSNSTSIAVQDEGASVTQLKNISNAIYGVLDYYDLPDELWRMDTTSCHTVELDFFPEVLNEEYNLLLTDSGVEYMAINGESTGQELWKYITQPISVIEICNNIDDDCNGIVDDNITFPLPAITFDGYQLCTDSYSTYHWYLNGAPISGALNQCYTPLVDGFYSVLVTDSTGCDGLSGDYPLIALEAHQIYSNELFLFPNPASEYLMIDAGDQFHSQQVQIVVTDLLGRTIFFSEIISSSHLTIDISSWGNGMYFVSFASENEKHLEGKFLKQ